MDNLLNIVTVEYKEGYSILCVFNNGETGLVDLRESIFNDHRPIFRPLRELSYFRNFKLRFNTITWENEVDFAPEYLYELGKKQQGKRKQEIEI